MDSTYTWENSNGVQIDMDITQPENIAIFSHVRGNGRYVIGCYSFNAPVKELADYIVDLFNQLPELMKMWD